MPNGDVELFRIGVLAQALHRKAYTLVQWEKQNWISKPSFLVHGRGREKMRFYSAQQVIAANRLIVERHSGKTRFRDASEFRDFLVSLDRELWLGAEVAREGRK